MSNARAVILIAQEVVRNNRPTPEAKAQPKPGSREDLYRRIRLAIGVWRTDIAVLTARIEQDMDQINDLINHLDIAEERDARNDTRARRLVEPFDD
jgi:hypothetical protein